MKLNLKTKTIIAVVLFVALFLALVLVATFLDYQISEFFTKGSLEAGEYYAHGAFGVMLECIGSTPIYFAIAFAACVLFWACVRILSKKNKPLSIVLAILCAIGVAAAFWYSLKDTMGYVFEHVLANAGFTHFEELDALEHSGALYGIEVVFGAIMAALAILATKLFDEEAIKKLLKFVLTAAVALAVANVLIMIIKTPIGRMRFRAINSDLGKSMAESYNFTRWYEINGQPNDGVLNAFKDAYHVSDAFKSFPSGHTCAAGSLYCLMMIPDLFDLGKGNEKKRRALTAVFWALPILVVALVAISRIMVGAHYLSDVTFGGTIAFLCVMLAREIIILKGSHFKALFAKKGATEGEVEARGEEASAEVADDESARDEAVSEEASESAAEESAQCAQPEADTTADTQESENRI